MAVIIVFSDELHELMLGHSSGLHRAVVQETQSIEVASGPHEGKEGPVTNATSSPTGTAGNKYGGAVSL